MITNIDQLKKFILWCKDNKIKNMEVGGIKFEISELDFLPEEPAPLNMENHNLGEYNTETLVDTLDKNLDPTNDPDLFWSTDI